MSYIQLEKDGQKVGLKFNQKAYMEFYKRVDSEDFVGTFHYAAAYAALSANAYVKELDFTESFESVCDWVDTLSTEDKELITKTFNDTAYFKKLVEDGSKVKTEDAPTKKKTSKNTMKTV